jgi:hypothetical protein
MQILLPLNWNLDAALYHHKILKISWQILTKYTSMLVAPKTVHQRIISKTANDVSHFSSHNLLQISGSKQRGTDLVMA